MSNSLQFDGTDFGTQFGVVVTNLDWPRLPPPRVWFSQLTYGDGSINQGASWGHRVFDIDCVLIGTSNANREARMGSMLAILATSQDGEKTLSFDALSGTQWDARLSSEVFSRTSFNAEKFHLQFIASNPWGSATASSSLGTDEAIPGSADIAVTPDGQWYSDVVYYIKNGTDEASAIIMYSDQQTGTFHWNNTLPASNWLKVDTANLDYAISDDMGTTWTSVLDNVIGIPPKLKGGVENTITVSGIGGTGAFNLAYTARYI